MFGKQIPKQRGIYSEVLTTEDTSNIQLVSTFGPQQEAIRQVNEKQRMPRAFRINRPAKAKTVLGAQKVEEKPEEEMLLVAKDYFRSSDVNEGHYSKKREGVADVDPKVMEPFEPIPGKPPRKVVIDRQRKLFASLEISELLVELGIDYSSPEPHQADWLPLENFDDTEYDCREPEEWISYGEQADGSFCPVPGKGLFKDRDGRGTWVPVLIHSYDHDTEQYCGYWDHTTDPVRLHRINILFDSEDPRIFAQRVAQAHSERIYADSQIRYNFFVDCMPHQGLHELDTEQQCRILENATEQRPLKGKQIDRTNIMNEVQMDFQRTMNQIIMHDFMRLNPDEWAKGMIPHGLSMPPEMPPKKVPYFGQITIPPHDFATQFSNFCFNSLFIKEEVIRATNEIRHECNDLLSQHQIWNIKLEKIMRIEEFKQAQTSAIQNMKFATGTEGWVGKLLKIIKAQFKDVGKGWFNIEENSKETYEFGKLKKYLMLVNFMMQDTVLNLCKDSVANFVQFMLDYIPDETIISSTAQVKNTFENKPVEEENEDDNIPIDEDDLDGVKECKKWINWMFRKNQDPEPLFQLDLIPTKELLPSYNNDPEAIVKRVYDIFEEGVKSLQDIPQLEQKLLHRLFRNKSTKNIKAPSIPFEEPKQPANERGKQRNLIDENIWLWQAAQKLKTEMQRAIQPLKEYVETFRNFQAEHELVPEDIVSAIERLPEQEKWGPEKIRDDIYHHQELEQALLNRIPESINVSMFRINCNDIRNGYAQKYRDIVEKEIQMIASMAKHRNAQLTHELEEIQKRVTETPADIDHLDRIKTFITNECGIRIKKKKDEITECMQTYEILEEFNHEFSKGELDTKWELFGYPQKITKIIDTTSSGLEKTKDNMKKQMELEQEQFDEEVEGLVGTVGEFYRKSKLDKYAEIAKEVESYDKKIRELQDQARVYNNREAIVGKEQKDYSRIAKMAKDFQPFYTLWTTINQWKTDHHHWMTGAWEDLDADSLVSSFEVCLKNMAGSVRFFNQDTEEAKEKFKDLLPIAKSMKADIDAFKPIVPLAEALRKEGMQDRHWDQLSDAVGFDIRPEEGFTLTTVVQKGMKSHVAKAEEIGEKAYKEFHIEKSLRSMKAAWENQNFRLNKYKTSGTFTVAGYDEAINLLDEHIVNSQAFQFSPFKKPFEEEINTWCNMLMLCNNTLEEWIKCQGAWTYLQPIFDSADIMKQLPSETKRFKSVDTKWRIILQYAQDKPSILANCTKDGLMESFIEMNKNLETVQKGLNEYLEKKRSLFARFYFLSDGELLEILSQTKEVRRVRSHLRKVFEAINDLEFKPNDDIVAMMSVESEKIDLMKKVSPIDRNVEFWMGDIEKQMCISMRHVFEEGLKDYAQQPRNQWVISHAGQIVLNASQVFWTKEVEETLKEDGYPGIVKYLQTQKDQLNSTVMLVREKLTKLAKISVNALIVIDVHARTVLEEMVDCQVSDGNAFEWIKQLRYYWEQNSKNEEDEKFDVWVKCVATVFPYGYEYLGNTTRLVITPLTDKCYMTLMGALQLNLGGAPAGPAGTGKTETTKDLAKALAKHCVVFNCSGDMTHTMVATFFKGLAASGAWCCFDEFNRINIEVLSVIAQYLLQLFDAKARDVPEITFVGSKIKMKPTFCVFITMNPGYAGRTELPDNLKALFRGVAMMVPDYALIGEISFYSFGFLQGKPLARKMVTTFTLSSEQLSSQKHYDYGMRAVKSVVNAAGLLKNDYPDMDESQLLLRALRDVNVPKFLKDDLPLFENIIMDLFPGVDRPQQEYYGLLESIDKTCAKENLVAHEKFKQKVVQLYDTIQVRHGLMLVGPTGGGKTSCYQLLAKAISALKGTHENFQHVKYDIMNPKSITLGQLYGFSENGEWQDGVLAFVVTQCSKDDSTDKRWVIFDGPVDAIWIENMNTVLDDNKKLCLNSGAIIQLTPRMTMMFEVADLAVASPATVSRCGMVYMEPEEYTISNLFKSWLNTIPEKVRQNPVIISQLNQLVDAHLADGLYFVRKNCPELISSVENNLAASMMRILDCYFMAYQESDIKKVAKDQIEALAGMIKQLFIFAFIWSIGATTTTVGREKFSAWMRVRIEKENIDFPLENSVYDWNYDVTKKEWIGWFDTIQSYQVDTRASFNEIVVPTQDSIRMKYIAKMLILAGKHVMMPGPIGTGKTVYLAQLGFYEMPEEYQTLKMTFSAQTSANQVQDFMDGKFDKHRKGVYGPPIGKKFIVFIDDVNMPMKEEFGAMPPIEIIRQFMDHEGWYDRLDKDKPFKTLKNLIFVSTMGPPGGGRQDVTKRLLRHYNFLCYTEMMHDSMETIFKTILGAFYATFTESVQELVPKLVLASLQVYDNVLNGPLKPIPAKSHYTFNLRDISKIFQGLCNANKKLCTQPVHIIRLWIHENTRVFGDRLTDDKDRGYINEMMMDMSLKEFKLDKKKIMNSERIIFGDFMDGIDLDVKIYKQIENLKEFQTKIEDYLDEYNGSVKTQMNLVMFLDACDHVARITRIIRQPLGNAFLLGVGGSGRQSLSRLATFCANYKVFQIEIVKGYQFMNWREDVKKVLMQCGCDNKPTSFIFVDTQIIEEKMLEDINNILNGGDVSNLYKKEDYEPIYKVGKALCMEKNVPVIPLNMFQQYLNRLQSNIHMVIAMSPLGEVFRQRLRQFPSLVTCCTLDWFSEWPEEALLGVGKGQIQQHIDLGVNLDKCVEVFKYIHQSVERTSIEYREVLQRKNYVTPTSFLEQLTMYRTILVEKQNANTMAKQRLVQGLEVLKSAAIEISKLQKEINEKQPVLIKTQEEISVKTTIATKEQAESDVERAKVAVEEEEARQQDEITTTLKKDAQAQLDEALPMLEEAVRIVNEIKVGDLYILRTYQNPTPNVIRCMELCCHMWSLKPKKENIGKVNNDTQGYYHLAREKFLSNPNQFLQDMKGYKKEEIPASVVNKVNPILNDPSFDMESIKKSSEAMVCIVKWAIAMMKYYELLKIVNPKREQVKQMQEKSKIVQADLSKKRKQLAELDEKLADINNKLQLLKDEETRLESQITDSMIKLERANKIIEGLSGEKERWTDTVARLGNEYDLLVGNCLVAAGAVAYSGSFTARYRVQMEEEWCSYINKVGIRVSPSMKMMSLLQDPITTKTWTQAQLPSDDFSIENAIIMFKSRRWPLMIDPQNQANRFIKNLSKDPDFSYMGIEAVKASDPKLLKILERCVQNGKWFLCENVGEELDPSLEPILLKQVDKSGSLRLGDKSIPYDKNFKFFMTTTIPNPHYAPETQVKVTLLNFAITPQGLEEQLLNLFIAQELPDQMKKKEMIIMQNAQSAKVLRDIEERILNSLNKHKEIKMILEDDEVIDILAESKITTDEINVRVKESAKEEKAINILREQFRPVAFRAQTLFFSIVDLALIDPMYQYSLQWFCNLYVYAIDNSPKSHEYTHRIKFMNDYFTLHLYENICRSLFERHKLMFSFKITINILAGADQMDQQELRFFLAGPSGEVKIAPNPTDWLGDLEWAECYKQIYVMTQMDGFKGFDEFFIKNNKLFQEIYDSRDPHREPMPGDWNQKLTPFQKMIVIKAIRADKVCVAVQDFIIANLGQKFVESPVFNLQKSYTDSSITTPLVFVLSVGSDPVSDFKKFADKKNMSKKYDSISLGRGMGPIAEKMIEDALVRGGWVLLMNCHLATSWMPMLEAIVEGIDDTKHRDFRLWLTSMPTVSFPVSVLQNSVKMTLEPPSGLKQNVLSTYESMDPDEFEACEKSEPYKKLLFGFSFFHAIVQDRRKFGPIGWNIPYAFTNEDLKVSVKQLKIFIEEYDEVPYKVLNYIGAQINYGGRVTDGQDVRLINVILEGYINPRMLEDNYPMSKSGIYRSIPTGELGDYVEYIKGLPLNPDPEAFGLHDNAEITTNSINTQQLLEDIISMQPKTQKGKGKTREEIIIEQAKYLEDKTPNAFDLEMVANKYPTLYEESMNTVLFQECVRYNGLLVNMKGQLISVQKGLVGEVVMSEELEQMAQSIYDNFVPALWAEVGQLSMKPLASWIIDCNERISFLNNWIENGTPKVFWMSGFFFPQAFLTGNLQNYARRQVLAVDRVSFRYDIKDTLTKDKITEKPEHGCYIYGMYIEGCKWNYDTHKLDQSDPKKLFVEMPMLHMVPVEDRVVPTTGIYKAPLYKVLSRTGTLSTTGHSTNFVVNMELPSDEDQDYWIRAGVAVFLALKF